MQQCFQCHLVGRRGGFHIGRVRKIDRQQDRAMCRRDRIKLTVLLTAAAKDHHQREFFCDSIRPQCHTVILCVQYECVVDDCFG